jgi:hypothetical protein
LALAAQETVSYINKIRAYPSSGVSYDTPIEGNASDVAQTGTLLFPDAIALGGARYELHTLQSSSVTGLTDYPLASTYVGAVPQATLVIRSEDKSGVVPRTRADRPFWVDVTVDGVCSGASDPGASKSVNYLHHWQSYGENGTDIGLNRSQATLASTEPIAVNGPYPKAYPITMIADANLLKIRGEERFSVFSLPSPGILATSIATGYIQIWPIGDATISGITQDQVLPIKFTSPKLTIALTDVYPRSTIYAQVYSGAYQQNKVGKQVPGAWINDTEYPKNKLLELSSYNDLFTSDGLWTMEIITATPFGTETVNTPAGRPCYVSFMVDKTIQMNGTVTTSE